MLRHLVFEDVLVEDIKKSDVYGSISSVLKVQLILSLLFWDSYVGFTLTSFSCLVDWFLQLNNSKVYNLLSGNQAIKLRLVLL